MSASQTPDFVLETYIKTTPEKLWEALTNGEITKNFFQGDASVACDFNVGDNYMYTSGEGNEMLTGKILEVEPLKRLAMTFAPVMMGEIENPSHNVYEIEQLGDSCKLTILHFGVTPELEGVKSGWSKIAARLKTLLETGKPLHLAAA